MDKVIITVVGKDTGGVRGRAPSLLCRYHESGEAADPDGGKEPDGEGRNAVCENEPVYQ